VTRINVVPVEELCDQHLLAEHRELTRIPNNLVKGRYQRYRKEPLSAYTLGKGHVTFFCTRLRWLHERYFQLHAECTRRGFTPLWKWPRAAAYLDAMHWQDYTPTATALAVNRERIAERMPARPRFASQYREDNHARSLSQTVHTG